jgi:F-type H+-transporting ATPase subunit b
MQRLFFICGLVLLAAVGPVHAAGSNNALEFRADTALWAVFVFAGLFLILRAKAWPLVLDGLQKREETIRSSLEEAKRVRSDMASMQASFQKEMADAQQQIPVLMEEARKKAEALASEMRAKAAEEIQGERERLRREVEIAKDQALKSLWEQTAKLATLISVKALGRSMTEDDHRRLIDDALREMTPRNN